MTVCAGGCVSALTVSAPDLRVMAAKVRADVGAGVIVLPVVSPRTVAKSFDGVVEAVMVVLLFMSVPIFPLRK